ncbi:MAG: hypothetical protein M1823_003448 [Watsoniomyces obsoletus]|nr:MAG: hypothetical protein M1823_003448 [Watsoniomyces obsoletus]
MDKLNFWGSHQEQQKEEQSKEDDLTTILKKDEQGELFRLVGAATEGMRSAIEANFESLQNSDIPSQLGTTSEGATAQSSDSASKDTSQQAEQGQQEGESVLKLKELRTALLRYFDDWQGSVTLRLGEVMNARDSAERQEGRSAGDQSHGTEVGTDRLKQAAPVDEANQGIYSPIPTSLADVAEDKRVLILHSMLLLLLSLEHYTAFSRVLLLRLTSSLGITRGVLVEDEKKVAQGLLEAAKHMSGDEAAKKRAEENKDSRRWKVGIASVAGAALIGVTGGLAAPLVAAGIGGVMGGLGLGATAAAGYLGTLAGSSVLVGGLFGAYGGRMTGQMMDSYAREIEDFAFLPVRGAHKTKKGWSDPHEASPEDRRLRVLIGISGWLTDKEDVIRPWHVVGDKAEVFALRYELDAMLGLGNALTRMVKTAAWGYAKSEIIKHTIFASLSAALWPLGLLKISRVVDNPFSIAKSRSDKAGHVLADALINRAQGERPVTLIGYSLGARVIYSCLMSLAERKAFGLVESAVLMGAPTASTAPEWRTMRSVVAGRLVNVYSENDYILGFLYRTSSIQLGIAGLQKVEDVKHIENIDVSGIVEGHLRYRYLVGSILQRIGFEDIDPVEIQKEEEALKMMMEKEEKERQARTGEEPDEVAEKQAEKEAEILEREVERKNHETFMKKNVPSQRS